MASLEGVLVPCAVDVADLRRRCAGIGERPSHRRDGASSIIVAVGQSEGVGRRAIAGDLPMDDRATLPGMFQLLEDEHATAFPEYESIPVAVEGPARSQGLVVAGGHGRQEDESGQAQRMNHAVRTAGEDHIGRSATNQFRRFADRLGAGRARGLAGQVRTSGTEHGRKMAGRPSGLLIVFASRMERVQSQAGESRRVDATFVARAMDEVNETIEVLLSLAGAQIDSEARAIEVRFVEPGVRQGERGRGEGELGRPAVLAPTVGIGTVVAQAEIRDLGRDPGGKRCRIEECDRPHSTTTFPQSHARWTPCRHPRG